MAIRPLLLSARCADAPLLPGGLLHAWPVRRTLLTAGVAAVTATAIGLLLPVMWAALCAGAVLLSFFVPRLRRPLWLLWGVVAAAFLLAAVGYRYVRVRPLEALVGQTDTVSGWITDVPTTGNMYTLEVTEAERLPVGSRLLLYCSDISAPDRYETVTARVRLEALYPTQASRRAEGIFLRANPADYGEESVRITGSMERLPLSYSLQPLQRRLTATLRAVLPGDEGALLAALCLGDRSGLSQRVTAAFRGSGVTHLLVVSGLHLSMVAAAVLVVFHRMRLGRRGAAALTMPVVLLFMLLIGDTPSVVRAGVMCLTGLAGRLSRSRADGLNSLGLAAMLLLLYNPYMLFAAGFQLSFLAAAGVLSLTPRLCRWVSAADAEETDAVRALWRRGIRFIYTGVAVCVSATLPTLPFLCYYFGGFPLIAPVANLLMVLPGSWALLSGWLGLLLYGVPLLRPLGQGALLLAGTLARYLQGAADLCNVDAAFVTVDSGWQIALVSGVCLLLVFGILYDRLPVRRLVAGVLTLAVLATGTGLLLSRSTARLTVLPAGQGATLLLQQGHHRVALVTHGDGLADVTRTVGDVELDAIVVGAAEPSDAGQLAQLCRDTAYPTVYTTDPHRWTAGLTQTTVVVSAGDTLSFGQGCRLTVLSDAWWRLDTDGDSVLICTDPDAPLPGGDTACGVVISVGALPTASLAARQGVLVGSPDAPPPSEAYPVALLTEESLLFTTRLTGQWSVVPWL